MCGCCIFCCLGDDEFRGTFLGVGCEKQQTRRWRLELRDSHCMPAKINADANMLRLPPTEVHLDDRDLLWHRRNSDNRIKRKIGTGTDRLREPLADTMRPPVRAQSATIPYGPATRRSLRNIHLNASSHGAESSEEQIATQQTSGSPPTWHSVLQNAHGALDDTARVVSITSRRAASVPGSDEASAPSPSSEQSESYHTASENDSLAEKRSDIMGPYTADSDTQNIAEFEYSSGPAYHQLDGTGEPLLPRLPSRANQPDARHSEPSVTQSQHPVSSRLRAVSSTAPHFASPLRHSQTATSPTRPRQPRSPREERTEMHIRSSHSHTEETIPTSERWYEEFDTRNGQAYLYVRKEDMYDAALNRRLLLGLPFSVESAQVITGLADASVIPEFLGNGLNPNDYYRQPNMFTISVNTLLSMYAERVTYLSSRNARRHPRSFPSPNDYQIHDLPTRIVRTRQPISTARENPQAQPHGVNSSRTNASSSGSIIRVISGLSAISVFARQDSSDSVTSHNPQRTRHEVTPQFDTISDEMAEPGDTEREASPAKSSASSVNHVPADCDLTSVPSGRSQSGSADNESMRNISTSSVRRHLSPGHAWQLKFNLDRIIRNEGASSNSAGAHPGYPSSTRHSSLQDGASTQSEDTGENVPQAASLRGTPNWRRQDSVQGERPVVPNSQRNLFPRTLDVLPPAARRRQFRRNGELLSTVPYASDQSEGHYYQQSRSNNRSQDIWGHSRVLPDDEQVTPLAGAGPDFDRGIGADDHHQRRGTHHSRSTSSSRSTDMLTDRSSDQAFSFAEPWSQLIIPRLRPRALAEDRDLTPASSEAWQDYLRSPMWMTDRQASYRRNLHHTHSRHMRRTTAEDLQDARGAYDVYNDSLPAFTQPQTPRGLPRHGMPAPITHSAPAQRARRWVDNGHRRIFITPPSSLFGQVTPTRMPTTTMELVGADGGRLYYTRRVEEAAGVGQENEGASARRGAERTITREL